MLFLLPRPVYALVVMKLPSRSSLISASSSRRRHPPPFSTSRSFLLLVKVAAVIGETFSFDILLAIFPVYLEEAALDAHLSTLVYKNFLTEENNPSRSRSFKFTHSMVRVCWRKFLDEGGCLPQPTACFWWIWDWPMGTESHKLLCLK